MNLRNQFWFLHFLLLITISGCDQGKQIGNAGQSPFEVKDFNALANLSVGDNDTVLLSLDYAGAFESGFEIPSVRQTEGGKFLFVFSIKNNTGKPARFRYKIHYQNESYKFNEFESDGKFNQLAHENFYGSWDDTTSGFKLTEVIPADNGFHTVSDSFKIIGNPRFERKCFDQGANQRRKRTPRVGH